MKKLSVFAIAFIALLSIAEPHLKLERCPGCNGVRGPVSLTPPNLGQHDGEIGVEPEKPFANHRFDFKIPRCPLCKGSGRREVYEIRGRKPKDTELSPCPSCLWSGVEPCRKCNHTGLIACSRCRSSKKVGWQIEEKKTSGTRSRHNKLLVTPCPECQGFGKMICTDCEGTGGKVCRKCLGEGGLPPKEKK